MAGLPPSDSSSLDGQPYYINGKIIITALIILFVIILFIIAFHLYTRVFWRRTQTSAINRGHSHGLMHDETSLQAAGLDKAIVDALPIFTYRMQPRKDEGGVFARARVIECAVCLAEFQKDDRCRSLPKCNHSFHADCIDKWFFSNTTCPLCRTSAELGDCDEENQAGSYMACLSLHTGMDEHMNGGIRSGLGNGSEHQEGPSLLSDVDMRVTEWEGTGEDAGMTVQAQEHHDAIRQLARKWQRSISDRFLNKHGRFRTNMSVWGRSISDHHWQVGGRSLSHISIDVPALEGIFQPPDSSVSSPVHCFSSGESQPTAATSTGQGRLSRLNSLRTFINREKKVMGQAEYNEL